MSLPAAGGPAGRVEYPYSGAGPPPGRTIECMLWSDPENKPPKELRDVQAMLRRAGLVLAAAMILVMAVLSLR